MTEKDFEKALQLYSRMLVLCESEQSTSATVCFAAAELLIRTSHMIGIPKETVLQQISMCWDDMASEAEFAEGALIH